MKDRTRLLREMFVQFAGQVTTGVTTRHWTPPPLYRGILRPGSEDVRLPWPSPRASLHLALGVGPCVSLTVGVRTGLCGLLASDMSTPDLLGPTSLFSCCGSIKFGTCLKSQALIFIKIHKIFESQRQL